MHNLKELRPSCSPALRLERCIVSLRTSVDGKLCSPERAPLHSIASRWIKLIWLCSGSEWRRTLCRGHDVRAQRVRAALQGAGEREARGAAGGAGAEAWRPQVTVLTQPEGTPSLRRREAGSGRVSRDNICYNCTTTGRIWSHHTHVRVWTLLLWCFPSIDQCLRSVRRHTVR